MTAACGGGTSGPAVGTQAIVDISTGVLGQILSKYGGVWALPGIALVSLAPLTASVFCATDPPAAPTFTTAEASALTQLTIGPDLSSGLTKLATLLTHWAWYELCICTSGAVVAPGNIPSPPAGTPTSTPSLPTTNAPCDVFTFASMSVDSNGNTFNRGSQTYAGVNPTSFQFTPINTIQSGTGATVSYKFTQVSYANADLLSTTITLTPGGTNSVVVNAVPGVFSVRLNTTGIGGTGNSYFVGTHIDAYCNNQTPGATTPACCPPDPVAQSQLSALLAMVELLQRQLAPFAYLAGASHVGLTGNSQFAVQGILGLSVNATALPTAVGIEAGDPNAYFGIGWVAVGTADGFQQSVPIRHVPQLIQPVSPDVTVIGYSLNPGVTATITELVREP